MAIKRPEKIVSHNTKPLDNGNIPSKQAKKDGGFSVDPQALATLLGKKMPGKMSPYFVGAPVWSSNASKKLHDFVVYALSKNPLFKDRPNALSEVANKICLAVEKSPNLTAKFLPYLSDEQ